MTCKNCHEELSGQEKFCSNCGQKNIAKLDMKFILSSFIDDFFNVDSKLIKTLKYLVLKPGLLSKEYMEGRRVAFLPPIRLYLVLSVIFFFLVSVIDIKDSDDVDMKIGENAAQNQVLSISNADSTTTDSLVRESPSNVFTINDQQIGNLIPVSEAREMYYEGTLDHYLDSATEGQGFMGYIQRQTIKANVKGKGFNDVLINQMSLFLLLFVPLLALAYATCFSRNKYGYIGHLIFNLHFNSFFMILLCVDRLIGVFVLPDSLDTIWTLFAIFVPQVYLIRAIMTFYERKWWVALYKYFLLIIGYSVLAVVFGAFVVASSVIAV